MWESGSCSGLATWRTPGGMSGTMVSFMAGPIAAMVNEARRNNS